MARLLRALTHRYAVPPLPEGCLLRTGRYWHSSRSQPWRQSRGRGLRDGLGYSTVTRRPPKGLVTFRGLEPSVALELFVCVFNAAEFPVGERQFVVGLAAGRVKSLCCLELP